MAGEMVHYELSAADADRAQQFWGGLFGWEFQGSGMPGMDYRMAQINDTSGVAIMQSDASPGHPNVYLATDDIDASVGKVRSLGGQADDKAPVPGHGWFSACKDTEGNAFHLWQGDASAGT